MLVHEVRRRLGLLRIRAAARRRALELGWDRGRHAARQGHQAHEGREDSVLRAHDGRHGRELWKSSGTRRGTKLVKDIRRGDPPEQYDSEPENLANVAGTLFFAANDGTHGNELWKTVP
jgi:ELWxxDGT repeat protein